MLADFDRDDFGQYFRCTLKNIVLKLRIVQRELNSFAFFRIALNEVYHVQFDKNLIQLLVITNNLQYVFSVPRYFGKRKKVKSVVG